MVSTVYTLSPHTRHLAYKKKISVVLDERNIAKYSPTLVYEGIHTEFLGLGICLVLSQYFNIKVCF